LKLCTENACCEAWPLGKTLKQRFFLYLWMPYDWSMVIKRKQTMRMNKNNWTLTLHVLTGFLRTERNYTALHQNTLHHSRPFLWVKRLESEDDHSPSANVKALPFGALLPHFLYALMMQCLGTEVTSSFRISAKGNRQVNFP
jgi:hypothetical protein